MVRSLNISFRLHSCGEFESYRMDMGRAVYQRQGKLSFLVFHFLIFNLRDVYQENKSIIPQIN